MDFNRIIVGFWFILPILYYLIRPFFLKWAMGKHQAMTSGLITNAYPRPNPAGRRTNEYLISYTFNVGERNFSAKDVPFKGAFKEGDRISIRFDPQKPDDYILVGKENIRVWHILLLIWLLLTLGVSFINGFAGLFCLFVCGLIIKVWTAIHKSCVVGIIFFVIIIIFFLYLGYFEIEKGINLFRACCFLGQNWLWNLWNHQPFCSLP